MTVSPKSDPDSASERPAGSTSGRYLEKRRDEDLADMLSTLESNRFIPVAALASVAEILTYLYGKDSESQTVAAAAETET